MLAKHEKEALEAHFKEEDLYNPAEAPEQATASDHFAPKCEHGELMGMCQGGCTGYAEGGEISPDDLAAPAMGGVGPTDFDVSSGDTTTKAAGMPLDAGMGQEMPTLQAKTTGAMPLPPMGAPAPSQPPPNVPLAGPNPAPAALAAPQAAPMAPNAPGASSAPPDQFDALVKALSARPSVGQGAMSALAGLADAIESGVARAPGPGFQKNLMESQQQRKQNLIDALKAKYEMGFKGQELGQGQQRLTEESRSHKANEAETEKARVLTQQGQDLALRNAQIEQGLKGASLQEEQTKNRMEQAQKGSGVFNAIGRKLGYGPPLPGGTTGQASVPVVRTHAEYMALPAGAHYQDANGKHGIKK
jgi:hypothetical protein